MKKIFSGDAEFLIKFIFGMIITISLLTATLSAQTTFTDEEMVNLAKSALDEVIALISK